MAPSPTSLTRPHTVTFDCWQTLLYEADSKVTPGSRARIFAEHAAVSEADAQSALRSAWRRHQTLWHRRVAFTGVHMTRASLEALGVELDAGRERTLIEALEEEISSHEIRAIEGARAALEGLARAGVRRALICDTGFTPGRVVRKLLSRVGLLELLEACVFSDEVGVPKPHPKAFQAALSALGTAPSGAVHVGDLRRSDVAGAQAFAMSAVRFRARHDDAEAGPSHDAGVIDCAAAGCHPSCERPEGDAVADSYPHLMQILGFAPASAQRS